MAELAGKRVLDWSFETASVLAERVVVVHPDADPANYPGDFKVIGGSTRSESVRAGLSLVPDDVDFVLVHDAARPLASEALYRRVVDALRAGAESVVPVIEVKESLKLLDDDHSISSVDRTKYRLAQTPQGFRRATIVAAHAGNSEATDDVAMVESLGIKARMVDGELDNLKITYPLDLAYAEAILKWRISGGR